jgi:hypothetical protein
MNFHSAASSSLVIFISLTAAKIACPNCSWLSSSPPSTFSSNISSALVFSGSNFFMHPLNSYLLIVPEPSTSAISIHYSATLFAYSSVTSPAAEISPYICLINLFFLSFIFFF